ncbi:MAG: metallophosphoesterase family protein [Oscillospiraceae bacterium]|jgi:putative phosphoesterase|nr:metallophosphoesterase family protein [Oscillospiraceae bacterium]
MRLLVFSDSHGRASGILDALHDQPETAAVFFLGDGLHDIEFARQAYPRLPFHLVPGNCDYNPGALVAVDECTCAGVRLLYTHGHLFHVKGGTAAYLKEAQARGVRIALFGHTHVPALSYEEGIYLFNPGSIAQRSYGIIDLPPAGIVCFHAFAEGRR